MSGSDCAIEVLDDLLQNNCQPEGDQNLIGVGTFVEVLDETALHRQANEDHDR